MEHVLKTEYDPERIPASIFLATMTTTQEWSLASNDSLFSIHIDTSVFSPSSVIPVFKSEELSFDHHNTYDYSGNYHKIASNDMAKVHGDQTDDSTTENEIREVLIEGKPDISRETRRSQIKSSRPVRNYKGRNSFSFCIFPKEPRRRNTPKMAKIKIAKPEISRPVKETHSKGPKPRTGVRGRVANLFCFASKK